MRVKKYLALIFAAILATTMLTGCPWDIEDDAASDSSSAPSSSSRPSHDSSDDDSGSGSAPSSPSTPDDEEGRQEDVERQVVLAGDEDERPHPIEEQPEHHPFAVPEAGDEQPRGDGHDKVAQIHHGLYHGGTGLGDVQKLLEVLVQHIEDGVGKPPQEEQGYNQNEGNQIRFPYQRCTFACHIIR